MSSSNHKKRRLRILTVGDGDLTFSLSLLRAFGCDQLDLTASVLQSTEEELVETYSNAADALRELREDDVGVNVLYGVDATRLDDALSSSEKYDLIMFNHPHLGTALLADSERDHALRHHSLLAHYLHAASKCLTPNGVIHLCLCGTQPSTWNVADAASRNGLELFHQCGTAAPVQGWLSLAVNKEADDNGNVNDSEEVLELRPVFPGYPAPRRYRNGRLGSKHFLGKYGYRHRRTRGDEYGGNEVDMAVDGSVNILFRKSSEPINLAVHDKEEEALFCCRICGIGFKSSDMLQCHQKRPALPDASSGVHCHEESGKEFSTLYALKTYQRQRRDEEEMATEVKRCDTSTSHLKRRRVNTINTSTEDESVDMNYTVEESATVSDEFDGKRLRWYCRQPSIFTFQKSKKLCEDMIKAGRIHINGEAAYDSSRIIRKGDFVSVVKSEEIVNGNEGGASEAKADPSRDMGVKIVDTLNSNIVVVFKPTGIRTCGTFSLATAEMIVASLVSDGKRYISLTKLETGCPGLACMVPESHGYLNSGLSVRYQYTALVFGHVPAEWSEGIYVTIPTSSCRRWKNNKKETAGEEQMHDDEESLIAKHNYVPLVSEKSGPNAEQLYIRCTERSKTALMAVSTVEVQATAEDGRVCNIISYVLRKLNHGVVNDRFCKREFAKLPRIVRNRLKKICIGCYRLDVDVQGSGGAKRRETVEVPVPDSLKASCWNAFLTRKFTSA